MQETQEMWVRSLGGEGPLEEDRAAHSIVLAWRLPGTEGPGRLIVHGVTESEPFRHPLNGLLALAVLGCGEGEMDQLPSCTVTLAPENSAPCSGGGEDFSPSFRG